MTTFYERFDDMLSHPLTETEMKKIDGYLCSLTDAEFCTDYLPIRYLFERFEQEKEIRRRRKEFLANQNL